VSECKPQRPAAVVSSDWLGHEIVKLNKDSIKNGAQPSDGSANARGAKPARAKPKVTVECLLIVICELSELLASPINSLKIQNRLVA
jgi:hypothetical protein